jgi:flagellar motility protein MotE (MotC chaperone)
MAKSGDTKTKAENPKSQNNGKKGRSVLFTLLTFLTVIIILTAVFGGVFYFVIHNNINGLADRYRSSIQNIPLAKLALPKVPDPLDPKYMTADEVKKKYLEFRNENTSLKQQLADMNTKLSEAQKYKTDYDNLKLESEKQQQDVKDRQAAMDQKDLELKDLKKTLDELTAAGNKEAFKTYFESVDPENAKRIYAEVAKELQTDANTKKFAQIYAAMDASAASQIFEQLGTAKIDMIAQTLQAMSKENSSEILASMTPAFAAKLTEKLDALYKGN